MRPSDDAGVTGGRAFARSAGVALGARANAALGFASAFAALIFLERIDYDAGLRGRP
jgi:hypothetical protein